MGYAVKLIRGELGIEDRQINVSISCQGQRHYSTYVSGYGTFTLGNQSVSYNINTSSTNPNYGTGSKTVWLSEL